MNTMIEEHLTNGTNYGITIGTELAIDTLFTADSEHTLPMGKYDVYINVYTIVRNIASQFNAKQLLSIKSPDVERVAMKDIDSINRLADGKLTITYYASSLEMFASKKYLPYIRAPRTVKQKHTAYLIATVVKSITKRNKYSTVPGPLRTGVGHSLILSNFIMDVISNPSNILLESHTGKYRDKLSWSHKLHQSKQYSTATLPMTPRMLLFMGTSDIFTPKTMSHLRDDFLAVSLSNQWSSVTTEERIKFDLQRSNSILYNNWYQTPNILR